MPKGNTKKYIPFLIVGLAIVFSLGYYNLPVSAISVATLIGGETEGVTGACCNGTKLQFDSVNPLNIHILDGEALWAEGFSKGYDHDNQTSSGYCALGKLRPSVCLTIISECETPKYIPQITLLGTGGTTCSLGF